MPDVQWTKLIDGRSVAQNGFLDLQDFCKIVLKRTKQAIYYMMGEKQSTQRTERDDSEAGAIKRGANMLVNLWLSVYAADQKNSEPKLQGKDGFSIFINRLKTAAKDELVARSKKVSTNEDKKAINLAAMRAAAGSE